MNILKKKVNNEKKTLLNNSQNYFLKAKYKKKYYNCRIIERGNVRSKVIFINCGWICSINNKDILF